MNMTRKLQIRTVSPGSLKKNRPVTKKYHRQRRINTIECLAKIGLFQFRVLARTPFVGDADHVGI